MTEHKKVLVVDDSSFARRITVKAIKDLMPLAEIDTAADGDEAIQISRNKKFDLVIMDFNMPGRDGMNAAEELKNIDPNVQITICTANIQDSLQKKAAEKGFGFIEKPVNSERLRSYVCS